MKQALERALAALIDLNEQSKGGIPLPAEIDDAMDALRDGIAALGAQEPVAYYSGKDGEYGYDIIQLCADMSHGTKLYTAPQQQTVPEGWPNREDEIKGVIRYCADVQSSGTANERVVAQTVSRMLAAAPKLGDR